MDVDTQMGLSCTFKSRGNSPLLLSGLIQLNEEKAARLRTQMDTYLSWPTIKQISLHQREIPSMKNKQLQQQQQQKWNKDLVPEALIGAQGWHKLLEELDRVIHKHYHAIALLEPDSGRIQLSSRGVWFHQIGNKSNKSS